MQQSNRCPRCGGQIVGFNGVAQCFQCGADPTVTPHPPTAAERLRKFEHSGGSHQAQSGGISYPQAGKMRGRKG